jgi:hypothetical protein
MGFSQESILSLASVVGVKEDIIENPIAPSSDRNLTPLGNMPLFRGGH